MAKATLICTLWLLLQFALSQVNGQQTSSSESKRKASEYFCVAQCLGLLGTDRPGQACYEETAKQALKTNKACDELNYEKIGDCCKDFPGELMPPPVNETDAKACRDLAKNAPLDKFLSTYVMTGPITMSGRFDFSNQGSDSENLIFNLRDGMIEFQPAKREFENAANGTVWRNLVSNAYVACQYVLAGNTNIARTVPVSIDGGQNRECRTTPGLLYQCMKRHMIANCPSKVPVPSPYCKDVDYYSYQCDPFK